MGQEGPTDTQPIRREEDSALSEMMLEELHKREQIDESLGKGDEALLRKTKPELLADARKSREQKNQLVARVGALEELLEAEREARARVVMDFAHQKQELERLERKFKTLSDPAHFEMLEEAAYTDELTGLLNRRGLRHKVEPFIEHVAERTRTARKLQEEGVEVKPETISVLMMDIDHFKRLNDDFNHATGDKALQTVARILEEEVRGRDDFVCRWGGEEFVVVLNHDRPGLGFQVSERIRNAIKKIVVTSVPSEPDEKPRAVTFTMSVGFERWNEGESLDDTLTRADKSLYEAKSNGRDQVWSSTIDVVPKKEAVPVER